MYCLHVVEEVVGVERQTDVVANLLGDAEVGRIVGTDAVGVQDVGRIALDHQVAQVVIEYRVVVLSPLEFLSKGYLLGRLVPCGVVFRVYGDELIFCSVVGLTDIVCLTVEYAATYRTIQFADGFAVVV